MSPLSSLRSSTWHCIINEGTSFLTGKGLPEEQPVHFATTETSVWSYFSLLCWEPQRKGNRLDLSWEQLLATLKLHHIGHKYNRGEIKSTNNIAFTPTKVFYIGKIRKIKVQILALSQSGDWQCFSQILITTVFCRNKCALQWNMEWDLSLPNFRWTPINR